MEVYELDASAPGQASSLTIHHGHMGGAVGVSFEGSRSQGRSPTLDGLQVGKLRPRGVKGLLYTSKSETFLVEKSNDWNSELILGKTLCCSRTSVLICSAAAVNLTSSAPGSWMHPLETSRFPLPSPSESKQGS